MGEREDKIELELETARRARALARMEQLKLEEAMSAVGFKSEPQGQSRRCDVLANNGSGESGCSKNNGSCLVTELWTANLRQFLRMRLHIRRQVLLDLKQLLQQLVFSMRIHV